MLRASVAGAGILLTIASLPGCDCEGERVTGIMIEVDSDMTVPSELGSLQVRIQSRGADEALIERLDTTFTPVPRDEGQEGGRVEGSKVRLPIRIGVVPQGPKDRVIRVDVTGTPGPDGRTVTTSAVLAFVPHRALLLPMFLARSCGGFECGEGQTCQGLNAIPECVSETLSNPPCILADLHTQRIEGCDPVADRDGGTDDCADRVCPPQTQCVGGACVSTDPCDGVECDGADVCSFGDCVNPLLDEDGDGYPASSDCDDRDPDVIPGSTRPCSSSCGEGVSVCEAADWQPCTAPTDCQCDAGEVLTESCGNCGTATRACGDDGEWEEATSACAGEGECSPGAIGTSTCEGGGECSRQSRTCQDDCTWGPYGACVGTTECDPGAHEGQVCGRCGEQTHDCTAQCVWTSWSACSGEGECAADQTEQQACGSCGTQTRVCSPECAWDAFGQCAQGACDPGANRGQACGLCGSQTQTCDDSCNWGAFGACTGEGVCNPGSTEAEGCGNCGSRTQMCNGSCGWDPWSACGSEGECAPGTSDSEACGNCGTRTRNCTGSCAWGLVGPCTGEGVCANGDIETQSCGGNSCNVESRVCSNCAWDVWSSCVPVGNCNEGEHEWRTGGCCAGSASYWECVNCFWTETVVCCDADGTCEQPCEDVPGCGDCP